MSEVVNVRNCVHHRYNVYQTVTHLYTWHSCGFSKQIFEVIVAVIGYSCRWEYDISILVPRHGNKKNLIPWAPPFWSWKLSTLVPTSNGYWSTHTKPSHTRVNSPHFWSTHPIYEIKKDYSEGELYRVSWPKMGWVYSGVRWFGELTTLRTPQVALGLGCIRHHFYRFLLSSELHSNIFL